MKRSTLLLLLLTLTTSSLMAQRKVTFAVDAGVYNRENEILPLWETKRPKTRKQNRLGKHKSDKGKAPYRSYRSELNAIARRASHEAYG